MDIIADSFPVKTAWFVKSFDGLMHCLKGGPSFLIEYLPVNSVPTYDGPVWVYNFNTQVWSLKETQGTTVMLDLNADDAWVRFMRAVDFPFAVAEIRRVIAPVLDDQMKVGLVLYENTTNGKNRGF